MSKATSGKIPKKGSFLGVFGHVAIDVICSVERFPRPNTCEAVIDRKIAFGGTGGNLAVRAGTLGIATSLASFVGDDFPSDYLEFLESKGLDLTDLRQIKGGRTCTIIMVSDGEHNQIGFVDQGVMQEQDSLPLLEHTIRSSKYVHVGTGRPGYALRVCMKARQLKKIVAFDPAQEIHYVYNAKTFSQVIKQADIFFCNDSEMGVALDYLEMNRPEEMLDIVGMIVNTRGKKGSRIMLRNGDVIDIPICKAKKVADTTGAGDAYRAGFYAGLERGMKLEDCGAVASASASFAVEDYGGQASIPNWGQVKDRAFDD